MRAREFTGPRTLDETINPDILDPRFKHVQEIGDHTYTATYGGDGMLNIKCYDGPNEIGMAEFEYHSEEALVSNLVWVDKAYRNSGIATTMYAYAKMLGNDIKPGRNQLGPGRAMWNSWERSGDARHLVAEETYQPPELEVGDKILKGKFKNSPAEIKGFKKDKHNQPVLKTNKGDIQLFKPRITKLMTESMLPGTYIHETSPEMAAQIARTGFKPSYEGIFFNRDGTGYSGGGYGEAQIEAQLNIDKLLDMAGDLQDELEELAENGDGEEIARYARKHGYQAWADDLQIAVLDPRCIKIVSIK